MFAPLICKIPLCTFQLLLWSTFGICDGDNNYDHETRVMSNKLLSYNRLQNNEQVVSVYFIIPVRHILT